MGVGECGVGRTQVEMTTRRTNAKVAKEFRELARSAEASHDTLDLVNFTFWCGAGFSKSWDAKYPTANDLFNGSFDELHFLPRFCLAHGVDPDNVSFDGIREIGYALELYGRHPELQGRYIDSELLRMLRRELNAWVRGRFNELVPLTYLSDTSFGLSPATLSASQRPVVRFFRCLFDKADGSAGLARGIRTNFLTTNYDFVIETVLDTVLGEDDSHFNYTYRGFTPTRVVGKPWAQFTHHHRLVQNLLKLNGGFEIRTEGAGYFLDYTSPTNSSLDDAQLILPSRSQEYASSYFANLFSKASRILRETAVLVVVGYSFPEEDALFRFLLRQFSESVEDAIRKWIFYVDVAPQKDRLEQVFPFCVRNSASRLSIFHGTFADFAAMVVPRTCWRYAR